MSYKLWHDFLLFVLCFMTLVIMCLDTYMKLYLKKKVTHFIKFITYLLLHFIMHSKACKKGVSFASFLCDFGTA